MWRFEVMGARPGRGWILVDTFDGSKQDAERCFRVNHPGYIKTRQWRIVQKEGATCDSR